LARSFRRSPHELSKLVGDTDFKRKPPALEKHPENDRELALNPEVRRTKQLDLDLLFRSVQCRDPDELPWTKQLRRPLLPVADDVRTEIPLDPPASRAGEFHSVEHAAGPVKHELEAPIRQPEIVFWPISPLRGHKVDLIVHSFGSLDLSFNVDRFGVSDDDGLLYAQEEVDARVFK